MGSKKVFKSSEKVHAFKQILKPKDKQKCRKSEFNGTKSMKICSVMIPQYLFKKL